MIFFVLIIMLVGFYFMFIAFAAMFLSWRCSWITRKERAESKAWVKQRGY